MNRGCRGSSSSTEEGPLKMATAIAASCNNEWAKGVDGVKFHMQNSGRWN